MRCARPTSTRRPSAANCRAPAPTGWRAPRRRRRSQLINIDEELRGAYILSADTVVAVGRRILPKADLLDEAAQCLRLLSGRNHRVHTAVCLVTPSGAFRQRLVETKVRFKRLNDEDIEAYLASGEWRGKAGAYAAQGIAGSSSSSWSAPIPTWSACRSTRPRRCCWARAIRSASAGSTRSRA